LFLFKVTNSGNLIGEFTNKHIANIRCENAIVIKNENELFVGNYFSNWNEGDGISELYIIEISKQGFKYNIVWRKKTDNIIFYRGEGFYG
jgi:hypothetical protein